MLLDTEQAYLDVSWIAKYQDIYGHVSQQIGGMVQQKRDADTKSKESGSSMRLERRKLPVFSGNIRDYARLYQILIAIFCLNWNQMKRQHTFLSLV